MSVEETLAAAAKATAAAQEAKPKKERVKKTVEGEGAAQPKAEKPAREPKAPRELKLYPQANEDGTQKFEEDGTTPVMGPKATAYKAPKAPKAPRVGRVGRVAVLVDGASVTLASIQNDAKIVVHKSLGSKEGSKRAERAKAFEGANTVQDFLAAGGVTKDLLRHLKTGAITLEIEGKTVSVAPVAAEEAKEETAE